MVTRRELREAGSNDTPNVVIENPNVRFWAAAVAFGLSLLAAIAALVFSFFPELAYDTDIPMRAIGLTNAVVSLLTSAFGITVLMPNIPYYARHVN